MELAGEGSLLRKQMTRREETRDRTGQGIDALREGMGVEIRVEGQW